MPNLGLTIDIFSALQELQINLIKPETILEKVRHCLHSRKKLVGEFIRCSHKQAVEFGSHHRVHTFTMEYEKRRLELEMSLYKPERIWMVNAFRFV